MTYVLIDVVVVAF